MKKILIVSEYMLCGGVEKSLLSLLKFINPKEYSITLMLLKKKGVLLNQIPDYVKVIEMPLPQDEEYDILYGKGNALKYCIKNLKLISFVKKFFRGLYLNICSKNDEEKRLNYYKLIDKKFEMYDIEYDLAIDYMGYGLINTFYVAKKINAKKKYTWVHFDPLKGMTCFSAFNYYLNFYDNVVCVSGDLKEKMMSISNTIQSKFVVFNNIVYIEDNVLTEKKYDLDKKYLKILSIGRLDIDKGFDIGIKVINLLVKNGYYIKWYIVGEGNQRGLLETIISNYNLRDKIVLLGEKTNPYPYLADCDIYFQPSRNEGYGIAVAEARAFYKPMVVTDFAGAKEQLKNNDTGLIVSCDVKSLYIGLKTLLDNKELRNKLSNNLKKENQSSQDIKQKVADLLEDRLL